MSESELLLLKTEALPPALLEEQEADKLNAKWLDETEFWNEDD